MGFMSGLSKALLQAAPYVAAPFTGGASLAAAPLTQSIASNIGQVAGNAAAGGAAGRATEADLLLKKGQLDQGNARNAADDSFRRGAYQGDDTFRRAQFAQGQQNDQLQRPGLFGKQALAGGLMQGLQDVNISRPQGSTIPNFNVSGGLRPSAMGQNARDAGGEMSRVALMNMLSGGPAPVEMGAAPEMGPGYQSPGDVELPQAGLGSKLLGGLGLGASLLWAIGQGMNQPPMQTQRQITPAQQPDMSYFTPNRQQLQDVPTMETPPNVASKRPYRNLFGATA